MGKQWMTLFLLGSKITADGDCSHEIKRHLLIGRKVMTNLDSMLKSRDIVNKGPSSQSYEWMREFDYKESWMLKNLCFWAVVLRVPWTARRFNQSILEEISPRCLLEGLMLKLKLQFFGYLMRRADSLEKTLMLGKIEGRMRRGDRGWDGWIASPTQWTWIWVNSRSWWWIGRPGMLRFMGSQRVGYNWATELNWSYYKKSV